MRVGEIFFKEVPVSKRGGLKNLLLVEWQLLSLTTNKGIFISFSSA